MFRFRLAHLGLAMAAIGFTLAQPSAYAANSSEVGKHLQQAQDLMKKGKYKEAMAQINDADHSAGKTAADSTTIEGLRAYVANAMGDKATAARAYESLMAAGKAPASEQGNFIKYIGAYYYGAKDYQKATIWYNRYLKEIGNDNQIRSLLTQIQYQSGNCGQVMKEIAGELRAADKAGRSLSEDQLNLLANCADKQGDKAMYLTAVEKLTFAYPSKDNWARLIVKIQGKPGFSARNTLDLMRLKLALGMVKNTNDFMQMAQMSLQANTPAESVRIIETGYKIGALGTGAEAERHKRLRDLATKALAEDDKRLPGALAEATKAKDIDGLAVVGFAYAQAGQYDKGIDLMQQALQAGPKHVDEIKLHLGLAYMMAGKKADAIKMLKTVEGTDGTAELARYWVAQINHPLNG